ncbi:hypothetical protein NUH88_13000 [Nisaea acidiphila]|uniref:Uncharacterized protein n=1 Tax=Nisaea acidiphila TaxID=1862145 RepID=A0A9J7AKZ9_9PROT|nr:hypothetical protein [Nisaea acidiphila]UUX48331.1 hypothetical protein NUH88_13000 [Nisaea acidiphila]
MPSNFAGWLELSLGITTVAITVGFIALGFILLAKLWKGNIDLKGLISEDGKASLSRFQFMLFTFAIVPSYFLLVVQYIAFASEFAEVLKAKNQIDAASASAFFGALALPGVSENVLYLIGISSGSYLGSKVTQKVAETSQKKGAQQAAETAKAPGWQ